MRGRARGLEMWSNYQATPAWRLAAGFMALHQTFSLKTGSNDLAGPGSAGNDPAHTALLRSSYNISDSQQLDLALRKVGGLSNPQVPGYAVLDARFGWRLAPGARHGTVAHCARPR